MASKMANLDVSSLSLVLEINLSKITEKKNINDNKRKLNFKVAAILDIAFLSS